MIISASRRTDIPAFYADWFMNRVREGFVRVKNPYNPAQIKTVSLLPADVDAIVFWTKNPLNLIPHLHALCDYDYYFLFTLTAYGAELEKKVPGQEVLVSVFRRLSDTIGPERVIWRYDPVFLSARMNEDYHLERFNRIAAKLASYTKTGIIGFLSLYEKCRKNLRSVQVILPDDQLKIHLAVEMEAIARQQGIRMQSCAEISDLTASGILRGACIDPVRIRMISGKTIGAPKDPNQRKECLCIRSVDIGSYNTCPHGCLFCYANRNPVMTEKYFARFDAENDMM